ncbi:hypothetical protein E2K93_03005 [Thalassotalea sp. HSM 43]|uniref:MipA/OmpV family protein n=1 Tax=Thalassotalea sp. HSM 43 TaxID=2552945 RepID=UPI001081C180|nr:MipA/OmpV family protein [Thalassotalea sp. HSM 43]QBY03402.1 hypothetical protein E2K93_03005 [Thalassotalea sp. HSM 43]
MTARIIKAALISAFCSVMALPAFAEQQKQQPIEESSQDVDDTFFAIKFSAGKYHFESPLNFKEDVEFYFLPTWTFYYKDLFFIENTKMGLNLYIDADETSTTIVDLVTRHNFDGLYYHMDDDFVSFVDPMLPPFNHPSTDAHLSYLGGVEVKHYYDKNIITFGVFSDISNVHHGEEAEVSWQRVLFNKGTDFKLSAEVGALYKSDQVLEYYYGSPLDGDNINYYSRIDAAYELSDGLYLVANFKYERLSSKIISSQATDKKELQSGFIGISWLTNW